MSEPSVRVQIVQPIAGSDETAALDMNFEVTPGHWTGATVTQKTARCLIRGLQVALDEIEAERVVCRFGDSGADLPDGWTAERALGRLDIHHLIHEPCRFRSFLPFDLVADAGNVRRLISTHVCK